jgi:hypothetical protein
MIAVFLCLKQMLFSIIDFMTQHSSWTIFCMIAKTFFSVLIFVCTLPTVHAEIYRWVDENGHIQFSDRPLNNKTEKVQVDTKRNSYGGGGVLERQRDLLDGYQANDAQQRRDKQQAAKEAVRDKRLQSQCINAKDRLKNYQRGSLYRLDGNGERIYYSEEERTKAIDKYQQLIDTNC